MSRIEFKNLAQLVWFDRASPGKESAVVEKCGILRKTAHISFDLPNKEDFFFAVTFKYFADLKNKQVLAQCTYLKVLRCQRQ
jgi:hypothetical protein